MASITELAARITTNISVIDSHLESKQLPSPSFNEDAGDEFPNPDHDSDVEAARVAVIEDTKALRDLVLGPAQVVRELCWSSIDVAVQRVIYRFKIHEIVPLKGSISYEDIAKRVGLSERQVKLMIRQSALNGIFTEPELDRVAHTASSAVLLRNKPMLDWYGHSIEEVFLASAKLADTLEKYPGNEDPGDSAFSVAFNTRDSIYTYFENHPDRQARFFGAMEGVGKDFGHNLMHVVKGYDWAKLGDATVVDVGGSSGFVSVALATHYPDLSFVVQDYEHTVAQGRAQIPCRLHDRITFIAHDFFKPQPVAGDVYIMRHICHNWSNANSARIIQQIVPVMKPTSKILLVEVVVVPPKTVNGVQERYMRNLDITMLQMLNTQERSEEDWQDVVSSADPRLRILGIWKPAQSWDSIIEIGFAN